MSSGFSADIVGLRVVEHGPDARVVTVTGEVDALTAPELAAFLTAQLAVAQLVVVNLDGVRFLDSAGLSVLFEVNELANHDHQARDLRLARAQGTSASAATAASATAESSTLPMPFNLLRFLTQLRSPPW